MVTNQGRGKRQKEVTAMNKKNTEEKIASRVESGELEELVRLKVQSFIQELLEEEVAELLGRNKSERREPIDSPPGYRNGHGKPRKLTLGNGTVRLRRPRVRGLEERFESRILPLFLRRTRQVSALLPELYLHGLAEGDFDMALRGLLGDQAPLSASTVARLKQKWQDEREQWQQQSLEDLEVVYLWIDGVYVKAGLEKEKAAVLVVLAGLSDGRKVFVSVGGGQRESTESWSEVLRDLKRRGMNCPRLVVGDGHLGIWGALRNVYPDAAEQRCWNHKILNARDKVPRRHQASATLMLRQIPSAETRSEAERLQKKFQGWCRQHGWKDAAAVLDRDWERMLTFYSFPKTHWQHIRTSNPVESPFSALRLRTDAARRFKKVDNATAVIWKMLMICEKRFRRLKAPELMRGVCAGVQFVDGVAVNPRTKESAA